MKKYLIFLISIFLFLDHVSAASVLQYNFNIPGNSAFFVNGGNSSAPTINKTTLVHSSFYRTDLYFQMSGVSNLYFYDVSLPSNYQDYKGFSLSVFTTSGGIVANALFLYDLGIECIANAPSITTKPGGGEGVNNLTDTEISVTTFYCPIENIDLRPSSAFRFSFSGNTTVPSTNIHFYFFDYMSFYPKGTTDSDIASAIQQQTNEITQQQQETNKQLGDLNDNLTNSDTSDASSSANEFFSGFESDDFGLSSIITAPLNLIKSITSSTCTPIGFKAPFVDQQITLPCMGNIYKKYFGSFLTLYQTITFGIVAYWVSVNIFFMVKGFKDPDSDRIEVLDL